MFFLANNVRHFQKKISLSNQVFSRTMCSYIAKVHTKRITRQNLVCINQMNCKNRPAEKQLNAGIVRQPKRYKTVKGNLGRLPSL